jgi:Tat protein translocase TatB subunit
VFGIGGWELLMIAVVALLVLGPRRLPQAARAIGRAGAEVRRATRELRQSLELDPDLRELPQALDQLKGPLVPPPVFRPDQPPSVEQHRNRRNPPAAPAEGPNNPAEETARKANSAQTEGETSRSENQQAAPAAPGPEVTEGPHRDEKS